MRAGGSTIQQALTTEAATVVKQAVTLARRRGHAQVTPLHVANTMLSSATGLLKTACLQSNSHPLQTKALELCFNVALNRLPASTSGPMLGGGPQQFPSISNALVAAFKRAQAHQRRGSIETQQQPVLAVKIELEQLVISILDDPSVSRVMREAGFSSTQVKSNIEQAVSLEICSSQSAPPNSTSSTVATSNPNKLLMSPTPSKKVVAKRLTDNNYKEINTTNYLDPIRNEDVMSVIDSFLLSSTNNRRSFVILGECASSVEAVVKGVTDKFEKGDVPEPLREVKFSSVSLGTVSSRVEMEEKLGEVKMLVRAHMEKGIVLNLGDLNWVFEKKKKKEKEDCCYDQVEQVVLELGKLASSIGERKSGRVWVIGMATFQAYYIKCNNKSNVQAACLDTVYGLHPLTIPAGILRLSLTTDSDLLEAQSKSGRAENKSINWPSLGRGEEAHLESEARSLHCNNWNTSESISSTLPPWLRQYKSEKQALISNTNNQACVSIKDLCNKWNTTISSSSIHQQHPYSFEKIPTSPNSSPSLSYNSSPSFSYQPQHPPINQRRQQYWSCTQESLHHSNINGDHSYEPPWRLYNNVGCQEYYSNPPADNSMSNPNSTPYSTSSGDAMDVDYSSSHKFKELSSRNLNALCELLAMKVPWQKDVVPEVASTVLKCRSGMIRRRGKGRHSSDDHGTSAEAKEETWLFFQGVDAKAKEKIARELAKVVFGSYDNFVTISLSNFSSTRADSAEDYSRNYKRSRDEQSCSFFGRFVEAISSNRSRVFLVEDVEQADYCSQMGFKRAIERGRVRNSSGEEVGLGDSIIILSCESFSSRSRACSPSSKLKLAEVDGKEDHEEGGPTSVSLDLNLSIENDHQGVEEENQSIDDIGLVDLVDACVILKNHDL